MDPHRVALVLIVGLAVARITALIVFDAITEPIRHRLFLLSPPVEFGDGELSWYTTVDRHGDPLPASMYRTKGWFGQLVSCYHCVGVWVSASVALAMAFLPAYAWPVVITAAVAQVSDTAIKATR